VVVDTGFARWMAELVLAAAGLAQDILSGAFTDENVVVFVERLLDLPAGVR